MSVIGLCQCGCGQPTWIADRTRPEKNLVKGQPARFKSGHNNKVNCEPVLGRTFGRLTALKVVSTGRRRRVLCKCECGTSVECDASNLLTGNTRSCGCLARETFRQPHPWKQLRPYEGLYNRFVVLAKLAGRAVTLSYDDFVSFTKVRSCAYCDGPIEWTMYASRGKTLASNLDRKDSSIGYTKENCVVCCLPCNKTKSNLFSHDEFMVMMRALKRYRAEGRTNA